MVLENSLNVESNKSYVNHVRSVNDMVLSSVNHINTRISMGTSDFKSL